MHITNKVRSRVMKVAWGLFRDARDSDAPRTFADALAGAWRFIKRLSAAKLTVASVRKSTVKPSLELAMQGRGALVGGKWSSVYYSARMGY